MAAWPTRFLRDDVGHLPKIVTPTAFQNHSQVLPTSGIGASPGSPPPQKLYVYYFRGELYCDVDILVVFEPQCDPLLPRYYELRGDLEALGERLGVLFDLTVLTEREFAERPLRDMDSLVEIAR